MRRHRLTPILVLLLAAATPHSPGRAEVVVRNDSFSTLEIAVVARDGREQAIGQAPPEFSNTLYFPAAEPQEVRFRARLQDRREVLHESSGVTARERTRLRWSLPDNRMETLRADGADAPGGSSRRRGGVARASPIDYIDMTAVAVLPDISRSAPTRTRRRRLCPPRSSAPRSRMNVRTSSTTAGTTTQRWAR